MGILESIKSHKKMSFNHWRYRILHWAFNIKNPEFHPDAMSPNGLPKFLYTHYCPLFHLTNLIALLSPLILGIRFFILVVSALSAVLDLIPFKKIFALLPSLPKPSEKEKQEPKLTLEDERRKIINKICMDWNGYAFESFWCSVGHHFILLTKDMAEGLKHVN